MRAEVYNITSLCRDQPFNVLFEGVAEVLDRASMNARLRRR